MRLFKVKPKNLRPEDTPVVTGAKPSAPEVPAGEVIDVETVMASTDTRDDAAPIGSIAAQDVAFKDVAYEKSSVKMAAEESRSAGLFGRFRKDGKDAAHATAERGAGRTEEATPAGPSNKPTEAKKVRLKWGAKPGTSEELAKGSGGRVAGVEATASVEGAAQSAIEQTETAPSYVPAPDEEGAGGRFAKLRSKLRRPGSDRAEVFEAPIRVLVGFLPEVSERDASEFAMGVAAKHFDNLGISYYDAFKHDNGYAYEVHEGGSGRAYLPEILKYYKSLGAFNPEDDNKVVVRTGTRAVEVCRARNGLSAVLLPEESKPAAPAWLKPTQAMRPAINKRTGFLVTGAVLFVSGFIAALTSGFIFRLQPYAAPVPTKMEEISYLRLPYSQWPQLQAQAGSQDRYVKALKYEKGAWRIETEAVTAAQPELAPAPAADAQAQPSAAMPPAPGTTP